jgi:hypothetical protein
MNAKEGALIVGLMMAGLWLLFLIEMHLSAILRELKRERP